MKHALGAGLIAPPVELQSSMLPICYNCSNLIFWTLDIIIYCLRHNLNATTISTVKQYLMCTGHIENIDILKLFLPIDNKIKSVLPWVRLNKFYSKEKDWVWYKARHYPLQMHYPLLQKFKLLIVRFFFLFPFFSLSCSLDYQESVCVICLYFFFTFSQFAPEL